MLKKHELDYITKHLQRLKLKYLNNQYFLDYQNFTYQIKETNFNTSFDDISMTYDVNIDLDYQSNEEFDSTNNSSLSKLYYKYAKQVIHQRFEYQLYLNFSINFDYHVTLGVYYDNKNNVYKTFYSFDDFEINHIQVNHINVDDKVIDLFGKDIDTINENDVKHAILDDLKINDNLRRLFKHDSISIVKLERYEIDIEKGVDSYDGKD